MERKRKKKLDTLQISQGILIRSLIGDRGATRPPRFQACSVPFRVSLAPITAQHASIRALGDCEPQHSARTSVPAACSPAALTPSPSPAARSQAPVRTLATTTSSLILANGGVVRSLDHWGHRNLPQRMKRGDGSSFVGT